MAAPVLSALARVRLLALSEQAAAGGAARPGQVARALEGFPLLAQTVGSSPGPRELLAAGAAVRSAEISAVEGSAGVAVEPLAGVGSAGTVFTREENT